MTARIVLVPLDGTRQATAALPVARRLAELEGATLRIVHVGEPPLSPRAALDRLGLTPDALRGSTIDQVAGAPAPRIVTLAGEWRCALVVLCSHTATDKPRGALGHVAAGVLSEAPCPVVLVPAELGLEDWTLRRLLLPQDGTPASAVAFAPATALARKAGAELVILHVAAPGMPPPEKPGTLCAPRYVDQPQHEWPCWTREFLERLAALGHSETELPLRLLLANGEPGPAIVRVARDEESDLIVLGWHGRLAPDRAVTLQVVLRDAPCPVFALRVAEAAT